ncbi:hypothetical protein AVEN_160626-1 [Araneus ventricosus]|uniref:Uncharacterized protein n=1 Tax=Araneus ventricosus TaxID=182803 RepID=A0A4Y2RWK7_ARAVE|nr:hypothetical protein AVEN_160626-1 [Araneus ventricosus]
MELRGVLADHFSTQSPNLFRLSERRTKLFNPAWQKSRPCPLSQFSAAVFTSLPEENLVPDKCLEPRLDAKSGLYGGDSRLRT